jgi:hypothetical protein
VCHGGWREWSHRSSALTFLTLWQVYATVLSTIVLAKPVSQSRRFSIHSTLTSFSLFMCYLYRDVWPLLTFTLSPADGSDPIAWASLTLAGITGILLPLCEPYPYIPYDPFVPQPYPNPEQTASLLSFASFAMLDPVIYASMRTDRLTPDMLPPQLDTDDIAALESQAYRFLDPFYRAESRDGKPRHVHVLRGLLAAFRNNWVLQALLYVITTILRLGPPIGTNRLLAYLENHGTGAVVRPWVWIVWIALLPLIDDVARQLISWLTGRALVHVEAVVTFLVYDHSLRIRVIHQPDTASGSDNREDTSQSLVATTMASGVLGTLSESDEMPASPMEGADTHSRAESDTTNATVVSSTLEHLKGPVSSTTKSKGLEDGKKPEPVKDVIGRLNNLVTSGEMTYAFLLLLMY